MQKIAIISQQLLTLDVNTHEAQKSLRALIQTAETLMLNPFQEYLIPREITLNIFKFFEFDDLTNTRMTCKEWEILSDNVIQKKIKEFAFGKDKWKKYFGPVEAEPPLPFNSVQILASPCPFWPNKKVYETHMLTLIPKAVDEQLLTLDSLAMLIQSPKTGHKTNYSFYSNIVQDELGTEPTRSHWVLMTKDVIPDSQEKSYEVQKALVKKKGYELPHVLDAAISILMQHVHTGTRLYNYNGNDDPYIFTRCKETVQNNQWPVTIGNFSEDGLDVRNDRIDLVVDYNGVGGARKFPLGS